MLMTINDWRDSTFAENSRPHYNTVLKWVKKGKLDHEYIAGNIYIRANATVEESATADTINRIAAKM